MAPATDTRAETSEFWQYVDAERRRAARAAALAANHAAQAASGPEELRRLHLRIANVHRQTEARHRATAKLTESHASRLDRWLCLGGSESSASTPTFMDAIAGALGTASAAATLRGSLRDSIVVAASDATGRAAYNLEMVLAEGPATDVAREGTPSAAAGDDLMTRWPRFGPAAAELGIYSVSAAPLAVPSARFGALCAYDGEPAVRQSVVNTTLEVAEALTQLLLTTQRTDLGATPKTALFGMFEGEAAVHQAAGQISVQCDCSVADAMALLAARAFADDLSVTWLANRVIRGDASIP